MSVNKQKRFFVTIFMTLAGVFFVHALTTTLGHFTLAWFGVLVSTGAVVSFLGYLFLPKTARTSGDVPLVSAAIGAGALVGVIGWIANTGVGFLPVLYALGNAGGWLAYVYWYSRFGRGENSILVVGEPLADITLYDISEAPVTTADLRGNPALLLFFRGNWCPLCMAQIKEISAQYRELSDRGVRVCLVSPQPQKHTEALAKRFEVPFDFLRDRDNAAAKVLEIAAEDGTPAGMEMFGYEADTVLPTAIIVDKEGVIRFADLTDNYRVRPEPATFIAVLDQMGS